MSRSFPWRRHLTDAVCWHQAEAQNATIFILREMGPTGFLLKEEGEVKNIKVYLGDPHSCTCSVFKKEKDLCKHICWLLLKKFRVPKENPITWQLGLVEREINEVLHGQIGQQRKKKPVSKNVISAADGREMMQQREIAKDDVCPICQDELLSKHLPVTYCKFSCGNSIHVRCMKIYAEHQQGLGREEIKCPICREDFGPLNLLKMEFRNASGEKPAVRMDRHLGTCCRSCHLAPIEGKCYRCSHCMDYYLCQLCFNTPIHTQHSFEFRHKRNQRWRAADRTFGVTLPQAVTEDLMNRDISSSDYDLLLQLDSEAVQLPSQISETQIDSLPTEMVRNNSSLLAPGMQCRVCLRGYSTGQIVKKLPCKHKFHKDCIKSWLLHSHPTCPIDGMVVDFSPERSHTQTESGLSQPGSGTSQLESSVQGQTTLEIPGIRIDTRPRDALLESRRLSIHRHPPRHTSTVHRPPSSLQVAGVPLGDTSGTNISDTREQMTSNHLLPGSQLLQKAEHHREWLGQQLAMLERSEGGQRVRSGDSAHAGSRQRQDSGEGGEQSLSNIKSVLPRIENNSLPSKVTNRKNKPGRSRINSLPDLVPTQEQTLRSNILTGLQTFQDLYLGNNPQVNPPVQETPPVSRGRLRPNVFMGHKRKTRPIGLPNGRTADIALEGNQIATLTLRDILRQ